MSSTKRLLALARESKDNIDFVDTTGEQIGADKIDKDLLETNVIVGQELVDDREAVKEAAEDAAAMGKIAQGLIGEDVKPEPISALAAEAIDASINRVCKAYGIEHKVFSRENHNDDDAREILGRKAQFAQEAIGEIVKSAWASWKSKFKSAADALFKTVDHAEKRIAQIKEKVAAGEDWSSEGEFSFKAAAVGADGGYGPALTEIAAALKAVGTVKTAISKSIGIVASDQFEKSMVSEEGARDVVFITAGNGLKPAFPNLHLTGTISSKGVVINADSDLKMVKTGAEVTKRLGKKEAIALLDKAAKVVADSKTQIASLSEATNSAYSVNGRNTKSGDEGLVEDYAFTAGWLGVLTAQAVDRLVRFVANDLTRYVEASAKPVKAPKAAE